jgi:plastocyanin
MNLFVRRLALATAVVATASCGGGGGGSGITGTGGGGGGGGGGGVMETCTTGTFCMSGDAFVPTTASAAVGAVVSWVNGSGTTHNVIFDNPGAAGPAAAGQSSGNIGDFSSGTQSRIFSTAGTYPFHCTIHAGMNGTLTVQ